MKKITYIILAACVSITGLYCSGKKIEKQNQEVRILSEEFKNYWYGGKAEITNYELEQARYGELHKGNAVMIFVAEPFNKKLQVKADSDKTENTTVLKLNSTRNFTTGIYPYSMMTSVFSDIEKKDHALKITSSSQDWCGQTFSQLNNKDKFVIEHLSYFESEGDKTFELAKTFLEDELWTILRFSPEELPVGTVQIIPNFFYLRLRHIKAQAYEASAKSEVVDGRGIYTLEYKNLKRKLVIHYTPTFPYSINSWEEETESGFGINAHMLLTKAIRKKEIKIDYWNKNSVGDSLLRKQLELD